MGGRRLATSALAALAAALVWAPAAQASFHLMSIREVYPGSAAHPGSGYVELQMYASGQNFVSGQALTVYNAAGTATGTFTFGSNVSNAANQQTILIGDSGVQSAFGVAPDLAVSGIGIAAAGGAACWAGSIDCVSWGSFGGSTLSPAGAPADSLGIADGMALRRTIAPGCSTLLEAGDDRDDSATDFSDVFPSPHPNSLAPSEHACAAQSPAESEYPAPGAGGGPAGGDGGRRAGRPQTRIRHRSRRRTRDRTPTFRFVSNQRRARFLCKLDRRRYRRCRSPFTAPRLRPGRHVFRVKARAPGGATDRSPAVWRFRVLRRARRSSSGASSSRPSL